MDEQRSLIIETAKRIFSDQCTKNVVDAAEVVQRADGNVQLGTFPAALWQTLTETGLTSVGIGLEQGGAGGTFADALLILAEAGSAVALIFLVDHLVALQLLSLGGAVIPSGIVALATPVSRSGADSGYKASFAEVADFILLVQEQQIVLIKNEDLDWQMTASIAGESLSVIVSVDNLQGDAFDLANADQEAELLGARARVSLMSGAMNHVLEMSVGYVSDRVQFGKALSKFQAIQHQLAVLAGEVASCQRASDSLLSDPQYLDVAIAKSRVGEAVVLVAEVAHQVHGAIGYTLEHGLNHRTRRLWQWRDEFGSERYWQTKIGQQFCQDGAEGVWPGITNLG